MTMLQRNRLHEVKNVVIKPGEHRNAISYRMPLGRARTKCNPFRFKMSFSAKCCNFNYISSGWKKGKCCFYPLIIVWNMNNFFLFVFQNWKPLNAKRTAVRTRYSIGYQNDDIFMLFHNCNQFGWENCNILKRQNGKIEERTIKWRPFLSLTRNASSRPYEYTILTIYNVLIDGNKQKWNTMFWLFSMPFWALTAWCIASKHDEYNYQNERRMNEWANEWQHNSDSEVKQPVVSIKKHRRLLQDKLWLRRMRNE